MEIKELKEKKVQLEKDIKSLIVDFIEKTGVQDIDVLIMTNTVKREGTGKIVVVGVSVNVDIKI